MVYSISHSYKKHGIQFVIATSGMVYSVCHRYKEHGIQY